MKKFKFLLNPTAILIGMVIGIAAGIWCKPAVRYLKPLGSVYMSLLLMCVLPIMASAIVVSIGKLMKNGNTAVYIKKIMAGFSIMLISVAFLSVVITIIARPLTDTGSSIKKEIGKIMLESGNSGTTSEEDNTVLIEIDTRYHRVTEKDNALLDFFVDDIIPENIFLAFTKGENLKVVFISVIFGIMLKFVSEDIYSVIMLFFQGVYQIFQKFISILLYILPFGLCGLLANQTSTTGFSMLVPLLRLVLLVLVISIVIFICSTIVIKLFTRKSIGFILRAVKDVIIIALGTRNSFAAIPSAIEASQNKLGLNKNGVNLVLPLGITMCRYGNIMLFSIFSVFAARLYYHKIDLQTVLIIITISILAAMAASGASGIVARTMISMVLTPLGIPAQAIIVMLITIDPIIDPIITLINIYPNCAATAVISSDRKIIQKNFVKEGCLDA